MSTRWQALPAWFREQAVTQPGAILLETAKFDDENFRSFLFTNPLCELSASGLDEVHAALINIDEHIAGGKYVAGFASYEGGELLDGLAPDNRPRPTALPLLRFGVFTAPIVFDHRHGSGLGASNARPTHATQGDHAEINTCTLDISLDEYLAKINRVQEYLAAGDSYQINFTDRVTGTFTGPPLALYSDLLDRQPVAFAALMNCVGHSILSLSPELFYRVSDGTITTKPMKGTWPRGADSTEDALAAVALSQDPKNRAEHVTIVDLLRSDLGRVCEAGSVVVRKLMQVERYKTLHQMTSTITGELRAESTPSQVFRALFPSGSITGAPKCRTMEIIRELERHPRGIYTGAIGFIAPDGNACFNVAIRTLVTAGSSYVYGVGGGITVDSEPVEEYLECQLKAALLNAPATDFHLIETMRAVDGRIPLLDAHLARLTSSTTYFEIDFNEAELREELASSLKQSHGAEKRVRLTLQRSGEYTVAVSALEDAQWLGRVLLSPQTTGSDDRYLRHKTSRRSLYDQAFDAATKSGFDEVLFLNELGNITEGAISSIILELHGRLITPPLACGVLPGVARQIILADYPTMEQRPFTLDELRSATRIWFCNALRGVRAVTSITNISGEVLWKRKTALETDTIGMPPMYSLVL